MAYATAADLRARVPAQILIDLTDEDGAAIDDAVLDRRLADASAVIDGYLGGRYPLPLAVVPPILVGLACTIAYYQLLGRSPAGVTEDLRKRYEDAIRYLEQVAAGRISLGIPAVELPQVEPGVLLTSGSERRFTRDSLAGA